MDIQGKVFVVTGGGNGMGREVVLGLLDRGAASRPWTSVRTDSRARSRWPAEH